MLMYRVSPLPDGKMGVQLIDGDFVTEVVGDDAEGLRPGYYNDHGVLIRSLSDEPVVFEKGGQRAHSQMEPVDRAVDRGVRRAGQADDYRLPRKGARRRRSGKLSKRRTAGGGY